MEYTTNYNLFKPDENDFYDVEDFNLNAEIIDTKLKEIENKAESSGDAENIEYDNTESGLESTNIQAAINEICNDLMSHKAESLPHKTADGGYRWNARVNLDNSVTLVFEEVV